MLAVEQAGDAVDFGGFDRLVFGHRRHDGGQALGEHRLAGAGRADHQEVVAARHGDLERALDVVLAFDIVEVDVITGLLAKELPAVDFLRGNVAVAFQQVDRLAQVGDAIDIDALDQAGFAGVVQRNEDGAVPGVFRLQGEGEDSLDRAHAPVEGEFADDGALFQGAVLEFLAERDNADGDGQIEARALLAHIGGGEIDGGAPLGFGVGHVADRRPHPVAALFDRRVGQANDDDAGVAFANIDFDLDAERIDTVQGAGMDTSEIGHDG